MKRIVKKIRDFIRFMENGLNEAAKADPTYTYMRPCMIY